MKYFTVLVSLLAMSFSVYASTKTSLKIVSYNIRNFEYRTSSTDTVELKRILTNLRFDLLAAQEIVNTGSFKKFITSSFPQYDVVFSQCGGGGRQKLAFVYDKTKLKLNSLQEDRRMGDPGSIISTYGCGRLRPALVGSFTEIISKKEFVAIALHLKAGGNSRSYSSRAAQYKLLSKMTEELKLANQKNILMLGDFNTTGFVDFDQDYQNFNDFLVKSSLQTISTQIQCTSYWSGMNRNDNVEESSVLDHIVHPQNFMGKKAGSIEVHSHCLRVSCTNSSSQSLGHSYKKVSDHCPISITFN